MFVKARAATLAIVAIGLCVLLAIGFRHAGRALVDTDPLVKSDAIVILGSQRLERTIEAGELYREGWAPRVVVSRVESVYLRPFLQEHHISVPLYSDIQRSVLRQMGVPANAILELGRPPINTADEANLTRVLAARYGWSRVMIVTSKFHSRRARWIFKNAAGRQFQVSCRSARLDPSDPDHWWRSGLDQFDVTLEYVKYPVMAWRKIRG